MTAEPLHAQVDTFLHRLNHLLGDGRRLLDVLRRDATQPRELQLLGLWQRECAATISQLSGGSKAHWLSRRYSDAFLLTSQPGRPATEATVDEIISRILAVLEQARTSLTEVGLDAIAAASTGAPAPTSRFNFVHDAALRADLERAYADGQGAFDRGEFPLALVTFASVLEAIITQTVSAAQTLSPNLPPGVIDIANWSFDDRIQAAERLGRISAGCARLPGAARRYRSLLDHHGDVSPNPQVSARDAKVTLQVLNIIIRDLAPGR